jgi:hypothetical protein
VLDKQRPLAASQGLAPQVVSFLGLSPQASWRISGLSPVIAHAIQGGATILGCGFAAPAGDLKASFFYLRFCEIGEQGGGKAIVFALPPGKELPELPRPV